MSFLIYFFVLLVSAASVLFGIGLATSPLPKTPDVPMGRSAQAAGTAPASAKQEAQRQAQIQASAKEANERALTPVYPTTPGIPKCQAETSGSVSQEQAALGTDYKTTAGTIPAPGETLAALHATRGSNSYAMEPRAQSGSNSNSPQSTGGGSIGYNQNLHNY
jgi:hypothetical protein